MDLRLRDKVAVVTGGSVAIGLAVVRGLAAEGTDLVLCARDANRLEAVAGQITKDFGYAWSASPRTSQPPGVRRRWPPG